MVRKKTGNPGELVSVIPNNMHGNHGNRFLPEMLQLLVQTRVRRGADKVLVVVTYCNSRALFTLKHVEDQNKPQNKQKTKTKQTKTDIRSK